MGSFSSWFSQRFSISGKDVQETFNEPLPGHMRHWWFCLGGAPMYLFFIQLITGILLCFYYETSATKAYESVRYITENVSFGWYIRNTHKWGATLMVAAVILHQIRVFFTGAYRKPRELNWIIGMLLLTCTLMLGFTGYSLVYEQLSYWGVTVSANITESIPIIGPTLKNFMLGGEQYNEYTLSRFFIIHAAILPVAVCLLVAIHIGIARIQGISNLQFKRPTPEDEKPFNLIPDHLYTELIVGLVIMVIITVLATVFPAPLGPKADPTTTPEVIKPEWFFFTMYRWLKLFSRTTALLSSGAIILIMFAWPFIDASIRKRTRFKEASVWIGIFVVFCIVFLTMWEALVEH
ncbi:MAG: Cytochrome b6 [Chlamydiae bacterium]|nr:Cytochrome b6 [Chlamydiota bacterium]